MVVIRSAAWRTGISARQRDRAVRLSLGFWVQALADPAVIAAYHQRVYRRGSGRCWPWTGAISSDGQAKLSIHGRVIAAPVLGWHLSRGLLRPGPDGRLPVIRHTCDESACCNPGHWVLGARRDNARDYRERKDQPGNPLTDRRGPGGRARAIRDAILRAQAAGTDVELAIRSAMDAGMPGVQDQLL